VGGGRWKIRGGWGGRQKVGQKAGGRMWEAESGRRKAKGKRRKVEDERWKVVVGNKEG
jgi:hypothetical protein